MTSKDELRALADRVEGHSGFSNELDVLSEIALFEPDNEFTSVRSNYAGTKVIFTTPTGIDRTFRARDFTISATARKRTAAALRAIAETALELVGDGE